MGQWVYGTMRQRVSGSVNQYVMGQQVMEHWVVGQRDSGSMGQQMSANGSLS